jgi:transcriptional regulator with XRE-family HTH domain
MISRIKLERIKREMTQFDLCIKTGIPQWRISLIERGITPREEELKKIASALNIQQEKFFPTENECLQGNSFE